MTVKIIADRGRCVGAGQCVLTDQTLFDQDDAEGCVLVLVEEVTGDRLARAEEAVNVCPSQALSLTD